MSSLLFQFNMLYEDGRPIMPININTNRVYALLDTGANMPLFIGSVRDFREAFPNASKTGETFQLAGFTGVVETKEVWEIPVFKFADTFGNYVIFYKFRIALWEGVRRSYQFLLSGSMFTKSELTLNYLNKTIHVRFSSNKFTTKMHSVGNFLEVLEQKQEKNENDSAYDNALTRAFADFYRDVMKNRKRRKK